MLRREISLKIIKIFSKSSTFKTQFNVNLESIQIPTVNGPETTGTETLRTFITENLIYMLRNFTGEHSTTLGIALVCCIAMYNEEYKRFFTTVKIKSLR